MNPMTEKKQEESPLSLRYSGKVRIRGTWRIEKKGKYMASEKLIASNKKARHDYFIEDTYETGIVLHGTEVKSLRAGHCSIKESFVRVDNGEVIIYGMHINPYEKGNIFNKDPLRPKKLMLHKLSLIHI